MPTYSTMTLYKSEFGVRDTVEADSPADVVAELERREAEPDFWSAGRYIDDSAGPNEFLVFDADGETVFEATVPLISAERYAELEHAGDCHENLLNALRSISENDNACDCHDRSWYGDGHDTQCPISVAGKAITDATTN